MKSHTEYLTFKLPSRTGFVNITRQCEEAVTKSGVREGLLVERVTPNTPAARAGLQAGDVVTAADARSVGDIADLRRALRGREGSVKLEVVRKGKKQDLTVKWP